MVGRGNLESAGVLGEHRERVGSNRLSWTVAVFAVMSVFGAVNMVRGPIVPELGSSFGAPEWQLGLVAPAATAGYLVAVCAVGFGAGHVRPRLLVGGGLLASAVSLFALGAAPVLPVFLAAMAMQGAAFGVVRGTNRPLLSHFYPAERGRVYGYYDMTWAVGAALGPLLVIAVLALADWRSVFWLLGLVLLGLAVRVAFLPAPDVETEEEPFTVGEVRTLFGRPEVLAMAAVMFFVAGLESGLFLWLPTYAASELPGPLAGVALTLFVGTYVPGRFVCGRLADRVGHLSLLTVVLVALVPVFAWTFVVASGLWVLPGILGIGLLTSTAFPLLTAYATDAAPEYSGPVNAIAAVASSLGVGIAPAVMGVAISGSGIRAAMQLLVVPLVVSVVLVSWAGVAERRRQERPASTPVAAQPAD